MPCTTARSHQEKGHPLWLIGQHTAFGSYILIMCIQFCSTNGGHLVEILSQEHEEILDQSVFSGLTYWIGLNDIATEGTYTIM